MTRRAAQALVLATVLLAGCVTPALNRGAYKQNAIAALESSVSETRTGQLAAQTRLRGDTTRPFADTVITSSEKAIGPIETSFGGVDPPSRADDELRHRVLDLLGDAEDALAAARIAVRRDDRPALRESAAALGRISDRLERAAAVLR